MRLRLVPVLALVMIAAACGGDDDGAGEDAASTTPGAGEAMPVTIEHEYGETTITEVPERIVTVGLTEQDVLLALGIVPVGTTEWFGEHPGAVWPWAQDELEALGGEPPELVGDATAVNHEAIAAQRPDLILAVYGGLTEEDYETLSAIAPTVAQPADYVEYGVPWQEMTRTVGAAVGLPDEADALVESVEAEFAAVVDEHPELAGASAVVATPYEGIFVYGPEDPRGRFLTSLGFELPSDLVAVTGEEYGGNVSAERADLLDVDVIVWLDADDAEGDLGGPRYATFDVHTEGREVFLDSFDDTLGGATSFVSPLSLPFLLDGLVPMLVAAVDGDPATAVPPSPTG
jgi:iron complex transport system substrate-binding protein